MRMSVDLIFGSNTFCRVLRLLCLLAPSWLNFSFVCIIVLTLALIFIEVVLDSQ